METNLKAPLSEKDVIILGGGLAGLSLARQLRRYIPGISVSVLERRSGPAPVAVHKVGESTSELSASYFREVLGLGEYLTGHQLPKFGFRFFFSPEHRNDISRRVEVGVRIPEPYPTHQIDRGIFENDLADMLLEDGVELITGATVTDVRLGDQNHEVSYSISGAEYNMSARWVIDASGRRGLLKRKLGLAKKMEHHINAFWFRIHDDVDIHQWSNDPVWLSRVDPGRRRLATNHLMGEGYWFWIIPLVSGSTSFGVVADPRFHDADELNTLEKTFSWLRKHEPVVADMLEKQWEKVMDFKMMKDFAYDTHQFYSEDRWALTGEAGAFLDPFYSPGSDFIALSNSWITSLIQRDMANESITVTARIFNHAHKELIAGWLNLYKDMYKSFGKTRVMMMKLIWDWASYWAVPCVMFMNKGYFDTEVLKQYAASGAGGRFARLNAQMQSLMSTWTTFETEVFADHYQNIFDLDCLRKLQMGLRDRCVPEALPKRVSDNLALLEQIAASIFQRVYENLHPGINIPRVDPYLMTLEMTPEQILIMAESPTAIAVAGNIREDINKMFLVKAEVLG